MFIKLKTIKNVKDFQTLAIEFSGEVLIKEGKRIIDAKSIMGLFSLNILNIVELELTGGTVEEIIKFTEEIEKMGIVIKKEEYDWIK